MLATVVSEECIELIVYHLFKSALPFVAAGAAHVAFLRFLHFMATFDFKDDPIIINTDDSFTLDHISTIKKRFSDEREKLPAVFIATPQVYCQTRYGHTHTSCLVLCQSS
jgi:U3 small nucleolar RNA-associated protein 22